MPLLSRLLYTVIITQILLNGTYRHWYRTPPPIPPLVKLHNWFISDWNNGAYPAPKRFRYKRAVPVQPTTIDHSLDYPPLQDFGDPAHTSSSDSYGIPIDAAQTSLHHCCPLQPRSATENLQLQAYLYSLSTPGVQHTVGFGSDAEHICIDTGASACISKTRSNFITLRPVNNLKIQGIGTGLPIEGIGTLRWAIRDDNNSDIELYVNDALYVPAAPMGLLHSKASQRPSYMMPKVAYQS